ncbi:hypothetical protein JHK87_031633 [Glycine soja]|nr:hypothetical protein JHK87_031633 [Glycine soja]
MLVLKKCIIITDGEAKPMEGELSKSLLENYKCYLLDCGAEVFVRVGRVTQVKERKAECEAAEVWQINGSAKTPLPKEDISKFYSGDCYIVLYTYHSSERKEDYYMCCWFGKDSTKYVEQLYWGADSELSLLSIILTFSM